MTNRWAWITFAVVCEVVAILLVKYYLSTNRIWAIFGSIIAEILLVYAYIHLLRDYVGIMYAFLKLIPILTIVLIGIVLYSEHIKSYQWLGLLLGVIAIILLVI